jgi:hypothetical protein
MIFIHSTVTIYYVPIFRSMAADKTLSNDMISNTYHISLKYQAKVRWPTQDCQVKKLTFQIMDINCCTFKGHISR